MNANVFSNLCRFLAGLFFTVIVLSYAHNTQTPSALSTRDSTQQQRKQHPLYIPCINAPLYQLPQYQSAGALHRPGRLLSFSTSSQQDTSNDSGDNNRDNQDSMIRINTWHSIPHAPWPQIHALQSETRYLKIFKKRRETHPRHHHHLDQRFGFFHFKKAFCHHPTRPRTVYWIHTTMTTTRTTKTATQYLDPCNIADAHLYAEKSAPPFHTRQQTLASGLVLSHQ